MPVLTSIVNRHHYTAATRPPELCSKASRHLACPAPHYGAGLGSDLNRDTCVVSSGEIQTYDSEETGLEDVSAYKFGFDVSAFKFGDVFAAKKDKATYLKQKKKRRVRKETRKRRRETRRKENRERKEEKKKERNKKKRNEK